MDFFTYLYLLEGLNDQNNDPTKKSESNEIDSLGIDPSGSKAEEDTSEKIKQKEECCHDFLL